MYLRNYFTHYVMSSAFEKRFPFRALFEFWIQPEVSWSQVRRVRRMIHGGDAFPAKICDTRSEGWAGDFSWRRLNERSGRNSPRLRLTATNSVFITSTQNVWLTVDLGVQIQSVWCPWCRESSSLLFWSWTLTSMVFLAWRFTIKCSYRI
jgi:hypothetical protein